MQVVEGDTYVNGLRLLREGEILPIKVFEEDTGLKG